MRYSIVSFSGNVLPSVWDAKSDNEEGALQEALAMYSARVSIVPGLLIDWQEGNVKRVVLNLFDQEVATLDNARELFGIATTAEHFEDIVQAMEAEEKCS
tara:strand:- start:240 stop:539 length:300 start_codon:yes stop_codon:yes gene_type:complete